MLICTIAAHNYLAKAVFLAETVRRHHPDAYLVLCQPERHLHQHAASAGFDLCLLPSDLGYDDLNKFAFRHTVIEFATAIKARLLRYLFERFPEKDRIVFLDPDIWVFGPLQEALETLKDHEIVVTPHFLAGEDITDGSVDSVFRVLRCGVHNLGFLGLRRSTAASEFLVWWQSKLETLCYLDFTRGIYLDQRWVDLACGFFPIWPLGEPGYNVANWNIAKRPIRFDGDVSYAAGRPLRFVHFSGIDAGKDLRYFKKYAPNGDEPIHILRRQYKEKVAALRVTWNSAAWEFDRFYSGELIYWDARGACRTHPHILDETADPFAESNEFFLSRV
ncbi:MAG TPA: hypothetical protein VML19_01095 [Verrucomicrobiae bacterium]|nr:hypothetical protein [Verrucomicrobiae bacterium]